MFNRCLYLLVIAATSSCAKGTIAGDELDASIGSDARPIDASFGPVDAPTVIDSAATDSAMIDAPTIIDAAIDASIPDAGGGTACATYSDCDAPDFPVCSLQTGTCVPGYALCQNDDAGENGDDGFAGATFLPTTGGQITNNAVLCSEPPGGELDHYRVAISGTSLSVKLAWSLASEQFKATVYRDNATSTTWIDQTPTQSSPVEITMTGLTPGDYLIAVWKVSPAGTTTSTPYGLTVWE